MTGTVQPISPSRRALLAGALGGLGAWAASAAARVHPVRATDDDPVLVGGEYTATTVTSITNNTNSNPVLLGSTTEGTGVQGFSSSGFGVYGVSSSGWAVVASSTSGPAVYATSDSNIGVRGGSSSSHGVFGVSESSYGVYGQSEAVGQPASLGWSLGDNTGVQGLSGDSEEPLAAKAKTGVYGYANQDTAAVGVWGDSPAGTGVKGSSESAYGVYGSSSSSFGVFGASSSWFGVYGSSSSGTGVYGSSDSNIGLYGHNTATDQPASLGWSNGGSTGVQGYSGGGSDPPAPKAKTGVYGYANQNTFAKGVWGQSPKGRGVTGTSTTGWAGYFAGRVYTERYHELKEISNPSAPGANKARLFIRDNGSGKTQLCIRYTSGAIQVLNTQP